MQPGYSLNADNTVLFATEAKNRKATFLSDIYLVPVVRKSDDKSIIKEATVQFDPKRGFGVACMKGSNYDPAHGLSIEEKQRVGEDPNDPGGYFIYNGVMCFVSGVEKMRVNQIFAMSPSPKMKYHHSRITVVVPSGTALITLLYIHTSGIFGFHTNKIGQPPKAASKSRKSDPYFIKEHNYINIFHIIKLISVIGEGIKKKAKKNTNKDYLRNPIEYAIELTLSLFKRDQRSEVHNKLMPSYNHYNHKPTQDVIKELFEWLQVVNSSNEDRTKAVLSFIHDHIFPNSPSMKDKIHMACMMLARIVGKICQFKGYEDTSKNNWAHKKLDTASVSFSQIFRRHYTRAVAKIKNTIDKSTANTSIKTVVDLMYNTHGRDITDKLLQPFKDKKKPAPGVSKGFELAEMINYTN